MIEVLIGTLLGAILILAGGSLLFFAISGQVNVTAETALQRDAQVVVQYLQKRLREATRDDISIDDNIISINRNGVTEAFYQEGDDFIFDPDTTTDDDEDIIVRDYVTNFEVSNGTTPFAVSYRLSLRNGDAQTEASGVVAPRN